MSVTSETDIGNLTLDLLSAGTVQDIVTPSNPTEELLNRWYDQIRRKVLREHPWNFAAKRDILSASSTVPAFGYTAAYPVPNDFIRLLTIQDTDGNDISGQEYGFEFVGAQRCIVTNAEGGQLRIRYVFDIQDVSKFDPLFVQLFAHELAMATAYKLTESNGNIERLGQIAKAASGMAKSIDGQENPPKMITRSRGINARRNLLGRRTDRINF